MQGLMHISLVRPPSARHPSGDLSLGPSDCSVKEGCSRNESGLVGKEVGPAVTPESRMAWDPSDCDFVLGVCC
jgi:hypothetical protein